MDQEDIKKKVPQVTPELVEYLERIFPNVCPNTSTPERLIWTAVGNVEVVRKLRHMLNKQE